MGVVEAHAVAGGIGDWFYGDLRRPFTVAGMWGLQRVLDPAGCPMLGLDGHVCGSNVGSPGVALAPSSLAFGDQAVGTTSASRTVTVTNSGNAVLAVTGLTIAGSDFTVASDTCLGKAVASGASCTVDVTFTPQAGGSRSSSLQIADNASGSPQTVSLSGNGVAPTTITLSATSVDFGNTRAGATATKTVTVTNTGTNALQVSPAIATGFGPTANVTGMNAGDFGVQSTTCNSSVAAGGTCTVTLAFKPTATGARSASFAFTSNATGSPHSVALTGTGK
jgi:hypothetical protein